MWLPLKAIISKKVRKDGKSLISYQYCYSSTNRVLLSTDIAVPSLYWNKKRQCISKILPREFGNENELNNELIRIKGVIESLIEEAKKANAANPGIYVKGRFTPKMDVKAVNSAVPVQIQDKSKFFAEVDNFIRSKEKSVIKESLASFRGMKEHLLAFENHTKKAVTFTSLDYNFYMELVEFLTYDYEIRRKKIPEFGLKTSTIGRTIKKLRMFVKDRVRRKIIPPIDMSDFKIIDEETDAIYLSYDEIRKIYYADLADYPHLIQYRDLFVLGCLTGLRFSDYSTLRYEDVRKGMLYKKSNKVDTWSVIPLLEEAQIIFNAHFRQRMPKISNPKFNKYIKEIGKLAGITELITFSYKKGNRDIVEAKQKYHIDLTLLTEHPYIILCADQFERYIQPLQEAGIDFFGSLYLENNLPDINYKNLFAGEFQKIFLTPIGL